MIYLPVFTCNLYYFCESITFIMWRTVSERKSGNIRCKVRISNATNGITSRTLSVNSVPRTTYPVNANAGSAYPFNTDITQTHPGNADVTRVLTSKIPNIQIYAITQ